MNDYESRIYNSYVSSGQAGADANTNTIEFDNPYYDNLIAKHLPKHNKDLKILDLACGHGKLIYALKKSGYTSVSGVDVSKEQVAVANKAGLEVKQQDLKAFIESSAKKSYDIIFMMDILEHFEKAEILSVLDSVHSLLKDDGMLVLHIPNGVGIFGMKAMYGDFTHHTAFTPQSIRQILLVCNFNQVRSFEDKPQIHGIKSFIRSIIWRIFTIPYRLLLLAEDGSLNSNILSQNMLVIAKKAKQKNK